MYDLKDIVKWSGNRIKADDSNSLFYIWCFEKMSWDGLNGYKRH